MIDINIDNYESVLNTLLVENSNICEHIRYIIFNVNNENIIYNPYPEFLGCSGYSNDYIFEVLGLDKYKFCEKVYGYGNLHGDFPEATRDINRSLIRITYALFKECEKQQPAKRIECKSVLKKSFLDELELEGSMPFPEVCKIKFDVAAPRPIGEDDIPF